MSVSPVGASFVPSAFRLAANKLAIVVDGGQYRIGYPKTWLSSGQACLYSVWGVGTVI
jgi:hypothetical protein